MAKNNKTNIVYENKHYHLTVGTPPKTPDYPEPFPVYLIWNTSTGVMEYFHQVLYYAKAWADQFSDMLDGKTQDGEETKVPEAQGSLFN